mgnify:CR=1 FL=1
MIHGKKVLLGSLGCVFSTTAAFAADLPTRKAAPVEYVRVCDSYGAGFFYIPGTDTCLRVGGLVQAQMGIQPSTQLYSVALPVGSPIVSLAGVSAPGLAGFVPAATAYRSVFTREIFGYLANARVELDSRTQSPYGTVRTFIRLTTGYGSSANYTTGSLVSALGLNAFNNLAGPTVSRELAFLDKAFIQFAGITAGRAQSFFDFYADAINYVGLQGSNSTAWMAAYTFTFGGGLSATLSAEDAASHRAGVYSVINTASVSGLGPGGVLAPGSVTAFVGAARMPNIVANIRYDQPWGAVQFSGAINQVRANLFPATAATFGASGSPTAYALSATSSSSLGFAVQGGVQFALDSLAPGDKLWLQATYAHGAIGYIQGNNLSFTGGVSATANYGVGNNRGDNSVGWTNFADGDCVFTYTGSCEKSSGITVIAALKHYWTPTVSSGFFGGWYQVWYPSTARTPVNPFALVGAPGSGSLFTAGITNFRESRLGTNLVWTPIKNFDIGAEMMWIHYMTDRPFGLAPDVVLQSLGLPRFAGTTDQFRGTLRMIRAF